VRCRGRPVVPGVGMRVPTPANPLARPSATRPAHHPAVVHELAAEASDVQLRIADAVTRFAGSMPFVYAHVVAFVVWMVVVERNPWPTLTLVVSLEAIFLSTFVMIGQNRQTEFQRIKADHDFLAQEQELHVNTELTRTIDQLVHEIHGVVVTPPATT
jgi:uncharacterized membrane protein